MEPQISSHLFDKTTFQIILGSIVQVKADVLVSSDDNYLSMGGGVSQSLLRVGGEPIKWDARKHIPLKLGDVVSPIRVGVD